MPEPFDAFEFWHYLRERWWYVPAACLSAGVCALILSALLPRQYSATASILIEPPAANDVRTATAVSPVYLESLKTYERFATSDTLFQRAIERFRLRTSEESLESLKKRVLRVSKLRDTKILEVTATLPDAGQAAALAAFLATETAALSRSVARETDKDLDENTKKQVDAAEQALTASRKALEAEERMEPLDSLNREVESLVYLRDTVRRELSWARADFAENHDETKQQRARELTRQDAELEKLVRAKNGQIAQRRVRHNALLADAATALRERDALRDRWREFRSSEGTRSERMRVIDAGVVPQRPSSPNTALNVAGAVILALAASILYLSAGFGIDRRRPT